MIPQKLLSRSSTSEESSEALLLFRTDRQTVSHNLPLLSIAGICCAGLHIPVKPGAQLTVPQSFAITKFCFFYFEMVEMVTYCQLYTSGCLCIVLSRQKDDSETRRSSPIFWLWDQISADTAHCPINGRSMTTDVWLGIGSSSRQADHCLQRETDERNQYSLLFCRRQCFRRCSRLFRA